MSSTMQSVLMELAEEFDNDAALLERIAAVYLTRGMPDPHSILWHEAVVYRCCADRLRASVDELNAKSGEGK